MTKKKKKTKMIRLRIVDFVQKRTKKIRQFE